MSTATALLDTHQTADDTGAAAIDGITKGTRRRTTRSKTASDEDTEANANPMETPVDAIAPADLAASTETAVVANDPINAIEAGSAAGENDEKHEDTEASREAAMAARRAAQKEDRRRLAVAAVKRLENARHARFEGEQALARAYERADGGRLDRTIAFYSVPVLNICRTDLQDAMRRTLSITHMLTARIGHAPAEEFVGQTRMIIDAFKSFAKARRDGLKCVWDAHIAEASVSYKDSSKPTEEMTVAVTCPDVMDILDAVESLDAAARYARLLEIVRKMTSDEYNREIKEIKSHARRAFAAISSQHVASERAVSRARFDSRSGEFDPKEQIDSGVGAEPADHHHRAADSSGIASLLQMPPVSTQGEPMVTA